MLLPFLFDSTKMRNKTNRKKNLWLNVCNLKRDWMIFNTLTSFHCSNIMNTWQIVCGPIWQNNCHLLVTALNYFSFTSAVATTTKKKTRPMVKILVSSYCSYCMHFHQIEFFQAEYEQSHCVLVKFLCVTNSLFKKKWKWRSM